MFRLVVQWGWLDVAPMFPGRLRERSPRQGFFEQQEYVRVRKHLPPPFQDVLDFAYYSGWRKHEILELSSDDVDLPGGVVPARPSPLEDRARPRAAPLRSPARPIRRRSAKRRPGSLAVLSQDGIPVREWRTAFRRACEQAGLPGRLLHDCRRTAARNLIRAGVPERVAMILTGQKARCIFDRYNIVNERELVSAGDQLGSTCRAPANGVGALRNAPMAQPDRALAFQAGGPAFELRRARHFL